MEATILHNTCDGQEPDAAAILAASFSDGGATGLFIEEALRYFNHYQRDQTVKTGLGYLSCAVLLQGLTFYQLLALRAVAGFKAHGLHMEVDPDQNIQTPEGIGVEHLNDFVTGVRGSLECYERMVSNGCPPNEALHVVAGGVPVSAVVSFDLWSLMETSSSVSVMQGNVGPVIQLIRRRVQNLWPWVEELELW